MPDFLHDPQFRAIFLSIARSCVWLLLLAVIFLAALEWSSPARLRITTPRKSVLGDLGFYFISGLLPNLLLALPLSVAAYAAYHFVPWRVHHAIEAWPIWLRALAAFVVGDFGFYWGHRWAHQFPFLWGFHSIHHSPEHVYFLISARAHPIDFVFIRLCGLVPIYILGIGAPQSVQGTMIATLLMLAITVWGFFIHANIRWRFGWLESLIATASVPPPAPYARGIPRPQLRVDVAFLGLDLRDPSFAPERMARGLWHRGQVACFSRRATDLPVDSDASAGHRAGARYGESAIGNRRVSLAACMAMHN